MGCLCPGHRYCREEMLKASSCIWKVRSCPCQTSVLWNTSSFSQLLGLLTTHWVSTVSAGQCPQGLMEGEVEAGLCLEGLLSGLVLQASHQPQSRPPAEQTAFPVLRGHYRRPASGSLCTRRLPDPFPPCLPAVCGHQLAREWTARPLHTGKPETLLTQSIGKQLLLSLAIGSGMRDSSIQSWHRHRRGLYPVPVPTCYCLKWQEIFYAFVVNFSANSPTTLKI